MTEDFLNPLPDDAWREASRFKAPRPVTMGVMVKCGRLEMLYEMIDIHRHMIDIHRHAFATSFKNCLSNQHLFNIIFLRSEFSILERFQTYLFRFSMLISIPSGRQGATPPSLTGKKRSCRVRVSHLSPNQWHPPVRFRTNVGFQKCFASPKKGNRLTDCPNREDFLHVFCQQTAALRTQKKPLNGGFLVFIFVQDYGLCRNLPPTFVQCHWGANQKNYAARPVLLPTGSGGNGAVAIRPGGVWSRSAATVYEDRPQSHGAVVAIGQDCWDKPVDSS